MNLKSTHAVVKEVLVTDPETRNSDQLLYIRVCESLNPIVTAKGFKDVMLNLKGFNLPSIETVGRCRRKLQAQYPDLRSTCKVQGYRDDLQMKFREYAKG